GVVDEIAGKRPAGEDAGEVGAIEAVRQLDLNFRGVRLTIAGETIRAERKRQRGEPRVRRGIAEPIDAVREDGGQATGKKRVGSFAGLIKPEHDAREAAVARQQEVPTRLRLEAGRLGKRPRARVEPVAYCRPIGV